jgi:hypothetical protein
LRSDGVDLEATTDAGGGNNVGWIADGESFDVGVLDVSAEQHVLPVLVRLRHGGH